MNDDDPYEPRGHDDEYDRRPAPDDYANPGQQPEPTPEFDPSYELDPPPKLARPRTAPSYVAVPCTHCGYNLTGVAIGASCPECGSQVNASLYAANHAPANGLAITSMVIGILAVSGLCCCPTGYLGILGLIFGIIANNQINAGSYNNASKGMATAGIICSSIAIALAFAWTLMVIVG